MLTVISGNYGITNVNPRTFHIVWYIHIFSLYTHRSMTLFVRHIMQTPWAVALMSSALIIVPIIGMHLVHKYQWEHWEPFAKKHK